MSSFASIDLVSLSTVTGGATTEQLLDKRYQSKYGRQGVVSVSGTKVTDVLGPGLVSTTSHVNVNALEGGDTRYTCSATVNTNGFGRVSNVHCRETSAE